MTVAYKYTVNELCTHMIFKFELHITYKPIPLLSFFCYMKIYIILTPVIGLHYQTCLGYDPIHVANILYCNSDVIHGISLELYTYLPYEHQ